MDLTRIQDLIRLVNESGVAEVEVEEGGVRIVVRKHATQVSYQPMGAPAMPYMMPQPMAPPPMASGAMQAPQAFPFPTGYPPAYPVQVPPTGVPPAAPATPAAPAAPQAPAAESKPAASDAPADGTLVRAPIVGTFYAAPSPDSDDFVTVGSAVKKGDTLCIIEAMKLMNEIEAEVSGTVKQILVDNAEPVEYDQPLFVIG
ncbi:MAG: acetyl-CoA carboxylase biotin carboxyl carrier protein [Bacteroidota bacterium]